MPLTWGVWLAVVDVPEGVGVEALPVRVGGGRRTRVPRGGLTGKVHVLLIDVSGIAVFLRPAAVGGVGVLYPRKGTPALSQAMVTLCSILYLL